MAIPILYGFAAVTYLWAFITGKSSPALRWTRPAAIGGIVLQGVLLGMLYHVRGHFPFSTVFEGLFLCSFLLSILYFGLDHSDNESSYGAFLWPVNFGISTLSVVFLNRGASLPPALASPYFAAHVSALFAAYACFFFSASVSTMYLLQYRQIKGRRIGAFFRRLPALETMDRSVMRADGIGLGLLIIGIVLGIVWIDMIGLPQSPRMGIKSAMAIVTAAIYFSEHLLRTGKGWQGVRTCCMSIVGFGFVLAMLFVGRHGF